jgi:D-inositol-3-phosphate glycosyltransferase
MRIVFYGSSPYQAIGYSKIAHTIVNCLREKAEVIYLATGGTTHDIPDRAALPIKLVDVAAESARRGFADPYGADWIAQELQTWSPDLFFIYNDIIVTCRIFNALLKYRARNPRMRCVSYLDIVYPYERLDMLRHVDRNTQRIFVFSEAWRRHLCEDIGISADKVRVFPHGYTETPLVPIEFARSMWNLRDDDFVFLNSNRNTYRKAQDILIAGFLQFLKAESMNARIKLMLHCQLTSPTGYGILNLIETECMRLGLPYKQVIDQHIVTTGDRILSDTQINLLYRACDVGINTCMGEGFGLCNLEHACMGKPQIVSRVGAFGDIFGSGGAILIDPVARIRVPTILDEHTGDLEICSPEAFADAMSIYFHDEVRRRDDGEAGLRLRERYAWGPILNTFEKDLFNS